MQKLKKYNQKRNFNSTNEPKGEIKLNKNKKISNKNIKNSKNNALKENFNKNLIKKTKNIFVIQHHFARREHFDFRIEHNGVLLSWAVPKGLSANPADKRLAVMVEDHPLEYANFEGVIPAGNYGAGTVEIYDFGSYTPCYDVDFGLKKGHIKIILNGKIFNGEYSLIKMDDKNWLIKKSDLQAENLNEKIIKNSNKNQKIIKNLNKVIAKKLDHQVSVAISSAKNNKNSSKNKNVIARSVSDVAISSTKNNKNSSKNPFNKCDVQLCTLTNKIPSGKNWAFEIKYDGYRILTFKQNEKINLITRNGQDYTQKLPTIAESLKFFKHNFVLDGEVVSFDEAGRSDFGLLQQNLKLNPEQTQYVVFDLLALNGKDLRSTPLLKRKEMLKNLLINSPNNLIFSQHVLGEGSKCFTFAKQHNLEGIVAKEINSTYNGKRDETWLKIKCYMRQEFVICGYVTTPKNPVLSALILAYYCNKNLIFVGKVGTGFNEADKLNLSKKLNKIKAQNCPLITNPLKKENVVWVKPKLVAEIQFAELTKENILRQPSFIALREDKSAKDVVLEANKND